MKSTSETVGSGTWNRVGETARFLTPDVAALLFSSAAMAFDLLEMPVEVGSAEQRLHFVEEQEVLQMMRGIVAAHSYLNEATRIPEYERWWRAALCYFVRAALQTHGAESTCIAGTPWRQIRDDADYLSSRALLPEMTRSARASSREE